jgi:hypothetical protein
MFEDRNQRPAITGPQVCFKELRHHLPGKIILAADPKHFTFKGSEAEGLILVLPSPPAEVEYIEMRDPGQGFHTIIGETIGEIREIEGLSIEGDNSRVCTGQMLTGSGKCGWFFTNIAKQVLPDMKIPAPDETDTKKDDGAGEEPEGLNIEKNEIFRSMEAGNF